MSDRPEATCIPWTHESRHAADGAEGWVSIATGLNFEIWRA